MTPSRIDSVDFTMQNVVAEVADTWYQRPKEETYHCLFRCDILFCSFPVRRLLPLDWQQPILGVRAPSQFIRFGRVAPMNSPTYPPLTHAPTTLPISPSLHLSLPTLSICQSLTLSFVSQSSQPSQSLSLSVTQPLFL